MKKLYVEVANTSIKREQGLKGRKKMAKNNGMLFDFPYSRRLSFWMSNTYLPLEIAFINEEGIITEIKEMVPMSTRAITSQSDCRYALEVNKGWFRDNGIKEGALVGGTGIKSKFNTNACRIAQMTPQSKKEAFPVEPGIEPPNASQDTPQKPAQQEPLSPDVILDKTHKEILEDADIKGKDLIIQYVTKEKDIVLPPKTISPPFTFEDDAEGKSNGIVKAWDKQTAGWKSFLVDNILKLEEVQKEPLKTQETETDINNK